MRSTLPQGVNQENICCLNTAVLVFVIADRRGTLQQLFDELRACVRDPSCMEALPFTPQPDAEETPLADPTACITNFLSLLTFWQTYYTTRGRDKRGLTTSSGFRFVVWQRVVKHLMRPDTGLRSLLLPASL